MPNRVFRGVPAVLLALGACAPAAVRTPTPAPEPLGLPPIPASRGALDIRVVHPTPTTPKPSVDSTFVYGSVGTGEASLVINADTVAVQPNGAFLAYLPVPASGTYQLIATAEGRVATASAAYRQPAPAPAPAGNTPAPAATSTGLVEFAQPRQGTVTGGADTLRTGSDVAIGRASPTGGYRWFLPRGARLTVTGQQGDQLRVRLDSATVAWVPARQVTLGEPVTAPTAPQRAAPATGVSAVAQPGWVDLRFDAQGEPFLVEPLEDRLRVTLYGRSAPAGPTPALPDPLVAGLDWEAAGPGTARATVRLARPLWGYQAFYAADGALMVRVRRPPQLDAADPLRGARIAIDPGHPPAGATGPTGLTEAEANLAISLRLADQLRARGAEVLLTRTENVPVGLEERVQMATGWNAHLLVSVHNNAFGEGVNPFRNHGTSTYYFHPFSAALARALDQEIVSVTRIPDLGARQGNLALVRGTWMPSTLTESLFMMIPQQEAALRDPRFLDRLAAAHLRGIERFLRERAAP